MEDFKIGDIVRDHRFNIEFFGRVISVNTYEKSLIVQRMFHSTDKSNYRVSMHMMEKSMVNK